MFDRQRVTARPWVIIGCGYTGERLARRLAGDGAEVWITRRSRDAALKVARELSAHARAADLSDPDTLAGWMPRGAVIVDLAPPAVSGAEGERSLVAAAHAASAARVVYVSSTSVYPRGDGRWIDEDAPVAPESRRGKARLAAENALLDEAHSRGVSAVVLRVVGIYGPGRGVPARLLAGSYRVIGAGDTYVNRIHVDDLVTAIMAAALTPELPRRVYNVADDEPETSRVYADAAADILGVARPPSVPESQVDPWVVSMLKANRRVKNARMKQELGVNLAYPTWREGLQQVIAEEGIIPRSPDGAGGAG